MTAATAPGSAEAGHPFRCSEHSGSQAEPLAGTASTVSTFLLLEAPGPWGADALRDSRLPEEVLGRLRSLGRQGIRPLLVRRPGRASRGPVRLFAAYAGADGPWLETASVTDVREVLDLPLESLGSRRSLGLPAQHGSLFLVCTHGRHDPCCAERGRPLAAALAQAAPEETWEVSHIGGDRFAANVLVLPHGLYYGRLTPPDVAPFAAGHAAGHLDLDHLRGRSSLPFAAQAAEAHLRRHLGETLIESVRLAGAARSGTDTVASFTVGAPGDSTVWEVRVTSTRGDPRRLTCRSSTASACLTHRVTGLARRGEAVDGGGGAVP